MEVDSLSRFCWSHKSNSCYCQVEVFDREGNKIYLSDNLRIELSYDAAFIQKTHSLGNNNNI